MNVHHTVLECGTQCVLLQTLQKRQKNLLYNQQNKQNMKEGIQ